MSALAQELETIAASGDCCLRTSALIQCAVVALRKTESPWIPTTKSQPKRGTMAIYWHRDIAGGGIGFPAIADEWKNEDHLAFATHWLDVGEPSREPPTLIFDGGMLATEESDGVMAMLSNALSGAYDDGFEGNVFNASVEAATLFEALDPEMRNAPEPTLEWLARTMANHYPMLAIIRALDAAAPGICGAFSRPRIVESQDDGA